MKGFLILEISFLQMTEQRTHLLFPVLNHDRKNYMQHFGSVKIQEKLEVAICSLHRVKSSSLFVLHGHTCL